MGHAYSAVQDHLKAEFERLVPKHKGSPTRNYLVLDEVFQLDLSANQQMKDHAVDLYHLGILFVLNKTKNGGITLEELLDFAELVKKRGELNRNQNFPTKFKVYCTYRMWKAVACDDGTRMFSLWFRKLFQVNSETAVKIRKGICYLNDTSIKTMYNLLNIKDACGIDHLGFFNLMQRVAETQGDLELNAEGFDWNVPVSVVERFAMTFITSFMRLMYHLGFHSGGSVGEIEMERLGQLEEKKGKKEEKGKEKGRGKDAKGGKGKVEKKKEKDENLKKDKEREGKAPKEKKNAGDETARRSKKEEKGEKKRRGTRAGLENGHVD